ncbi:MAG: hypothetical protein L6R42_001343 [Xanthoria sp. 1 TBL-2021]|nr:MAG: hypothetical protein L6R42_001343 [Xanthoria sp. 1 TBL-2021]
MTQYQHFEGRKEIVGTLSNLFNITLDSNFFGKKILLEMLPEPIAACYVRYKAYESTILGWVVSVSNACGYKKAHKPGNRYSITVGSTLSSPTLNAKKYIVPRDEILPRVEQIVNCTKPHVQVPAYVTSYLRKSIADRERCNTWFQGYYVGDVSTGDSTDAHIHFTEMLKSMLSMLNTIALEPSNLSQPQNLPRSKSLVDLRRETDDKPRYEDLRRSGQVEDLETEEESFDSSDGSTTAVSEDELEVQTRTEKVYEAESTDDADRLLAVHDLLRRLRQIRGYVEETWSNYRERHISLNHATIVTNAAIDCAQDLEHKFGITFPKSPVWGDLIDLLFPEVTAHWQKDPSALSSENIRDMDMIFLAPTTLLKVFLDVFGGIDENWDKTWLQTWLPDVNKVYDPRADVSKLSCHDKLNRTIVILDSMIPELALHTKVGTTSTRNRVTAGFKDMLDTRRVRLWVVFSFVILCDIPLLLGGDVFRPFKDMRQQLERARKENHDYVENTDNTLMDGSRRELNENSIRLGEIIAWEDVMMEMRSLVFRPSQYVSHAQKPLLLLSHHPLLCGSVATNFRLDWQRYAIVVADLWHHTSAVLHLHSALKHEGCLPTPLPFLDGLQELYGIEKVFFGNPPTRPQEYKSHYLLVLGFSIQWFATNKRKGAHTQNKRSKGERIRDLTDMRPLLQLLEKEYGWQKNKLLPRLSEFKEVVQQHYSSRQQQNSHKTPRCDDVFSDPMIFLSALSEWLKEEKPRLDFDYYRAHNTCWRLLRRIEASPKIQKKFREAYDVNDSAVDQDLKYIPSFIFSRHLEEPNGKWMQSVGETVAKFFREEPAGILSPISPPENPDDPMDIKYAKGFKMSEDVYHPEKNGKCYHIGVCELQVVHWRIQAGLGPWDEGDADGAWWQGLRADLTEEKEAKTAASHRKTSAPAPPIQPLAITAKEVLAIIPPEGLSLLEVVTHFRGRLHKAHMKDFSSLLRSVSNYHGDTRWFMPLLTKEKAKTAGSNRKTCTPATTPPLTITAEEILALIPPEGLNLLDIVTHFRGRLHKAQMKEFSTMLRSITKYDRDTKWMTPVE